ncbi:SCO family protein [Aureimonas frigidaquae]|uniref:SCO family protein n=1 Tax=Aureimonas frigidaquae TaxID=424757 RepID=UPI00078407DF|nr:SCO family protein [Aureimonas frigidaquae]
MSNEPTNTPRRRRASLRIALWVLVALVAALLVLVWAVGLRQFRTAEDVAEPYGVPFQLVDQDNAPVTESILRGGATALFFGFTHCPDVCPTTLYELAGFQKQLADEGKSLNVVFVTVDPARDTPDVLKTYVAAFGPGITGVTGTPEAVNQMLDGFGVHHERVQTGDGYTMDHTASVILLGSAGQFVGTIAYQENSDTALEKLDRLTTL